MTDQITLLHLGPEDAHVLKNVRPETFDYAIDPVQARAFLMDPAHEIVVAIDGGARHRDGHRAGGSAS